MIAEGLVQPARQRTRSVPQPVEASGTDISLRGYGAVHCAAALRVTSGSTVALAGDRDLLAAWQREGLQVLDTQS